ncbi:ATP-binding cassette domain-containing protein [Arenibaculum pallidiluteum]|uniref:ATP-binding cassette domain-containing protein n=1 Tax=Arenibaculum pallidiluteum TaxID=2812559 RepID=UPI001A96C375|nr:ATP-binding cassette domain-containing protein [Arenibaculum pallidiluteum]
MQDYSATLLETRNLTMRFGGVVANNDVSFTLKEAELRCLIGPNGAGKSTFFKMLSGQLTPSSGSITFRGQSIAGAAPHEIARLGMGIKTQVPNVFNGLSVRENIWIAASRKHTPPVSRRITDEVLDKIRLTDRAGDLVGHLAHGQRQWVEIGTVLAGEPDLILLDEPAAGMTDAEVLRTAEIIKEINRTRALIVVEHDMQFIRMIAKTVTVFHQGQILMEDTIGAVMADQRVRDVYLGKKVAA